MYIGLINIANNDIKSKFGPEIGWKNKELEVA